MISLDFEKDLRLSKLIHYLLPLPRVIMCFNELQVATRIQR